MENTGDNEVEEKRKGKKKEGKKKEKRTEKK